MALRQMKPEFSSDAAKRWNTQANRGFDHGQRASLTNRWRCRREAICDVSPALVYFAMLRIARQDIIKSTICVNFIQSACLIHSGAGDRFLGM